MDLDAFKSSFPEDLNIKSPSCRGQCMSVGIGVYKLWRNKAYSKCLDIYLCFLYFIELARQIQT